MMLSFSAQASIISFLEVAALGATFSLYRWHRWAGWLFGIFIYGLMNYIDGHVYWGAHNLFGLL